MKNQENLPDEQVIEREALEIEKQQYERQELKLIEEIKEFEDKESKLTPNLLIFSLFRRMLITT